MIGLVKTEYLRKKKLLINPYVGRSKRFVLFRMEWTEVSYTLPPRTCVSVLRSVLVQSNCWLLGVTIFVTLACISWWSPVMIGVAESMVIFASPTTTVSCSFLRYCK